MNDIGHLMFWYKLIDFFLHWNCWQRLQKTWWSRGVISEKSTWVRFPAKINIAYNKLAPINDLFLIKFLMKRRYMLYIFLQNIKSGNLFSYTESEYRSSKNSVGFSLNFLILLCWFVHSENNSILGYI